MSSMLQTEILVFTLARHGKRFEKRSVWRAIAKDSRHARNISRPSSLGESPSKRRFVRDWRTIEGTWRASIRGTAPATEAALLNAASDRDTIGESGDVCNGTKPQKVVYTPVVGGGCQERWAQNGPSPTTSVPLIDRLFRNVFWGRQGGSRSRILQLSLRSN